MLETIIILLFLILLALGWVGVRLVAVFDDVLAVQAQVTAALTALAAQKAASITPAQAQQILANEQTNLAAANALITP